MTDLADRRANVSADLAVLEREQGAALLDGKDFDANLLAAKHGELAVLDAAESEAARRQREAEEADAHQARVAAAVVAKAELEAFRAAVAAAEEHGRGLAVALSAALDSAKGLKVTARALGIRPPLELDPAQMAKALSLAVGQTLDGIDRPLSFGHFHWPGSFGMHGWEGPLRPVIGAFEPLVTELTE